MAAGEEEEQQQWSSFGLADDVLAVLPTDPFEQLDVARKITSIALATRVSKLESEAARLRQRVAEKDDLIAELRAQLETLDASLANLSHQLEQADQEKESLLNENASLSNTVKKLNRDVSKLEAFRKTLVQSLQEEEEASQVGAPKVALPQITDNSNFSTWSLLEVEDAALPPKLSSLTTQISGAGSSVSEDAVSKDNTTYGHLLASHSSTPTLSPPRSPPRLSATRSPTRLSNPVSPRRNSVSLSTRSNMIGDRSSIYSSMPSSLHSSMSSPFDGEAQTGRTRVDGKEFFRQVRSRLSYEQFSAFLANVKELNSHKQAKEETLRKADEIFGLDNKDLYVIFESLINRNLH